MKGWENRFWVRILVEENSGFGVWNPCWCDTKFSPSDGSVWTSPLERWNFLFSLWDFMCKRSTLLKFNSKNPLKNDGTGRQSGFLLGIFRGGFAVQVPGRIFLWSHAEMGRFLLKLAFFTASFTSFRLKMTFSGAEGVDFSSSSLLILRKWHHPEWLSLSINTYFQYFI